MSTTFTNAITTVADILNRTDVNTQIGAAINTALRKLERKPINYKYMLKRNSVAVVLAKDAFKVPMPDSLKRFVSFKAFQGTDFISDLTQVTESDAYTGSPNVITDTGPPSIMALVPDSSEVLIRPTADADYNLWYSYYAYSAPLVVSSAETHWLLSNYEEVLIYGALVEMVTLIKDFDRETLWRGRFGEVLKDLKNNEASAEGALESPFMEGAYGSS